MGPADSRVPPLSLTVADGPEVTRMSLWGPEAQALLLYQPVILRNSASLAETVGNWGELPSLSETQTWELEATQRSPLHFPPSVGIPSPRLF